MQRRPPHRGADGDLAIFARSFILSRMEAFKKDMEICLTGTYWDKKAEVSYAYFPALAACCGFLEYMTDLHRGKLNKSGWPQVVVWTNAYLPKSDYPEDVVRVLFDGFRHSVAHRGIATGIWLDKYPGGKVARRITWKLFETTDRPACRLVVDDGNLTKDSPWTTPHTHRMHIHLGSLAEDLCKAAIAYAEDLGKDSVLQDNFRKTMQKLYPR